MAAFLIALSGCSNMIVSPPLFLSVTISPRPGSIPQGTSVVLTATASNNLSVPQWSILDASYANDPGTLTQVPGSPNSIRYNAPPSPPFYAQTPTGITQGSVTVNVTVADPPGTSIQVVPDAISLVVTSPSVAVSLAPATASVPLGGTAQFFGYAVGTTNNALTWQVNGVTGGSAQTGTINVQGTYVAPVALPMSGSTVMISIISQADPTKTTSAIVTLH